MGGEGEFLVDGCKEFVFARSSFHLTNELSAFAKLVAEHEREMCAKVCEELPLLGPYKDVQTATLEDAAAAIRARRQA